MELYNIRINFKKSLEYGDRGGPGVNFSTDYHSYSVHADGKTEAVKELRKSGGVWTGHPHQETLWVPFSMFESIEVTKGRE